MGQILLYRGINQPNLKGTRIGRWWSTDPYYALRYSGGHLEGKMFVAKISEEDLRRLSVDVSIDEGYENFYFRDEDPQNIREVARHEKELLYSFCTFSKAKVGGELMKPPPDPIERGKRIFG